MLNKMKKSAKRGYYMFGAGMTVGMMGLPMDAMAGPPTGGADFTGIAKNITESSAGLPGMISGVSYLVGSLLAVLGVMKIKDHVEKPDNTPLKDGAIRLTAGGALFALPIVTEAMLNTAGAGGEAVDPTVNKLEIINPDTLFAPGGPS